MTTIKQCTCEHTFQDKIYGKGNRVWNIGKEAGSSSTVIKCTVCNKTNTTLKK